jgi:hypothetical protein
MKRFEFIAVTVGAVAAAIIGQKQKLADIYKLNGTRKTKVRMKTLRIGDRGIHDSGKRRLKFRVVEGPTFQRGLWGIIAEDVREL